MRQQFYFQQDSFIIKEEKSPMRNTFKFMSFYSEVLVMTINKSLSTRSFVCLILNSFTHSQQYNILHVVFNPKFKLGFHVELISVKYLYINSETKFYISFNCDTRFFSPPSTGQMSICYNFISVYFYSDLRPFLQLYSSFILMLWPTLHIPLPPLPSQSLLSSLHPVLPSLLPKTPSPPLFIGLIQAVYFTAD